MTPKMKAALFDAEAHGLMCVGGRWIARTARGEPAAHARSHANVTVCALRDRCILDFWGPEQVAHLTEIGRFRLEIERGEVPA